VAEQEDQLSKQPSLPPLDETEIKLKLSSEYFILRTALEWRQDRLGVAEHMFKKATVHTRKLDPKTAENMADLLYEMGSEMQGKNQHELAVKWLERAYNVIMSQELEKLSPDASELRTSIMQRSVKALISLERVDASEKAHNLVDLLESDIGDKLVVLLLRLELLESPTNETFESDAYNRILQRMICSVTLTDTTFRLIIHHIRKLNDKSPGLACKTMDGFLKTRLLGEEKIEWTEKALINRLWMATSQKDGPEVIAAVDEVLNTLSCNSTHPITASATHAAQTVRLVWCLRCIG
jgi:hypothetical protein